MDRLAELCAELDAVLQALDREATRREARALMPPLAWLDEANRWLNYELRRLNSNDSGEPVPFSYIPADLRK